MTSSILEILNSNNESAKKALFLFAKDETVEKINLKFNLWARYFFPQYFTSKDAEFHKEIDDSNIQLYKSDLLSFVNAAFRGAAKTARTKLFVTFCIANDQAHFRKYFKVLCADADNSKQIVTDIYNALISYKVSAMYPEIFEKTNKKREETMESFTTTTGVKVVADSVGTDQRGAIQEESRPDFIWFEDFENRTTLRSAKKTKAISENMEEARTGLAKNGGCLYTCNYVSESGTVHSLITKPAERRRVLITPILKNGVSMWPDRYSEAEIEIMRRDDEDFEGERLCKPSASKDILFDRETLDNMVPKAPIKEVAGFKIFKNYDPSHRYGSGHDVAGGVGLDSSTSAFIDFETVPAQVVGTFANNTIKPEVFGDEVNREANFFPGVVVGIEKNNHGHTTIARARQLGVNLLKTPGKDTKVGSSAPTEYGWETNGLTKPKMIFALSKAIEDGLLILNDINLINELKSYTRNDLIDDEHDPRLTTRHFDLLIAVAIAWQTKDYAQVKKVEKDFSLEESKPLYNEIGI